jgi:cysteinyl-tRNA synthetase
MSGSLKLYNTLTRSKEVFEPIDRENVRLYVCGPTVYDYAHIGNARPLIVFDVLYRLLRYRFGASHVVYARNITDVDDKINARAARDFPGLPLNQAIAEVTRATERQFHEDAAALGCLPPDEEPHATSHIGEMVAIIERLVSRGLAYVAEDNVLFSPAAMDKYPGVPAYGSLARRALDEMIAGARVDVAPYKRDAVDFVLWKPSKPNEPGWPSPCGIVPLGRPGWHIECSAMSMATLLAPFGGGLVCDDPSKNIFDIHGGGIDLVFPHHENEIAQSCCAFDIPRMANVWMHNGFLQVEGEKMSKSLGNFITISELLRGWKGEPWSGGAIRYAMLGTHYRQPIDWTLDRLNEAKSNIYAMATYTSSHNFSDNGECYQKAWFAEPKPSEPVLQALDDDLNTPEALSHVNSTISRIFTLTDAERVKLVHDMRFLGMIGEGNRVWLTGTQWIEKEGIVKMPLEIVNDASLRFRDFSVGMANGDLQFVNVARNWLESNNFSISNGQTVTYRGLSSEPKERLAESNSSLLGMTSTPTVAKHIADLLALRDDARARRNWTESDRLRARLDELGIVVKDNKNAPTTWEFKR